MLVIKIGRYTKWRNMEGNKSLALTFCQWWYGEAYAQLFQFLKRFWAYVADLFSVRISLATLFAPWKRDVLSMEGLTLQERFNVWLLNLTSRFIGFFIKMTILGLFAVVFTICFILSMIILLFWAIWPLAAAAMIINGLALL